MAIIDELIFWISWLVALVATPLIWYCWFMVLRIGFFSHLNYGESKYEIQDYVVDFLVFVRLIKRDNDEFYIPESRFSFLNKYSYGYLLLFIVCFVLILFSYGYLNAHSVSVPEDLKIKESEIFEFMLSKTIIVLRNAAICAFIVFGISLGLAENRGDPNNLMSVALFLLVFCITSLFIGSGVFLGMAYLIDVLRWG